ncbi:DUF1631 family protein [Hahella sp. SMD15-11]|uniref:DUF1631 family protein n=1 Tax=Thermohahella caldifontis TaxID=3142973 RepID=A0AB39UWX6_9GAMM
MNDITHEKRQYQRFATDRSVELVHGELQCSGRLVNVCAGGALVVTDPAGADARALAARETLHMKIRLARTGIHDVPCRVVRGEPGLLALRFEAPQPFLVEALAASSVPAEAASGKATLEETDALNGLYSLYRAQLRPLVDRALNEMRQGVAQSRIPFSLKRYADALIAHHADIADRLVAHVAGQWESWQGQGGTGLAARLSLLEDADIEGWLAVNVSTRKIEQHVAATYEQLKRLLRQLEKRQADYDLHPLSPRQLAEGLRSALLASGLNLHELAQVLPFLADPLGFHLKQLYRRLIRYAQEQRATHGESTGTDTADERAGDHGPSLPLAEQRRMLHELYSLYVAICGDHRLARQHLYALTGLSPGARETEDMASRLEDGLLRTAREQVLKPPYRDALRDWVESILNREGMRSGALLPPELDERIELYGRTLDALAALSDAIPWLRDELAARAACFLADLIQSDDIYSVPDHPLRLWLNALGRLANLPAPPATQQARLLEKIALLNGRWPHDRQIVLEMTRLFDDLSRRQAQHFKRIRERKARTEAARQQRLASQIAVGEDLRTLLVGNPVPATVIELLYDQGLRQALVVSWLKHHGGERYRAGIGGLRQLLEALRARAEGAEDIPATIWWPEFRRFIQDSLPPPADSLMINRLSAELEGRAEVALRNLDAAAFDALEASATDGMALAGLDDTLSEPDDPWQRKIYQLNVGDWVIDRRDPQQPAYMRLAWRSGDRLHFTVSGLTSLTEQEFDLHQLAGLLAEGRIELALQDKHPLMDKVIQQIVQSFYSDIASQTQQDPLTGALTRYEFEQLLERYHLQATAERVAHHLLLLDVDHFRLLNTTLGHPWGDRVLQTVSQTLREMLGSRALVGRMGGDEFAVLLLRCNAATAGPLADEIHRRLSALTFGDDGRFRVTFSMGLAQVDGHVESAEIALRHASLACMQAKERGGDSLRVFKRRQIEWEQQRERLGWLRRLDDGMESWIQLRAQPIHDLHDPDALPHFEILMAVRDKTDRYVSPAGLIEVAERYHRMPDVDRWVFRRVMDWMEQHPETLAHLHGLSINLSGNTINDPAALDDILNELTRRRVPRRQVTFEITETAAVSDLTTAVQFIREVRQLGCSVSLDDFGTGMSSYAYLQELPVDYVKIDGIFVRNLKDNVKDQALVRSIAEMAQLLGMKTIAEFVEDPGTEEFLRLLGVRYGQGYLYGRPVRLEELANRWVSQEMTEE